MAIINNSYGFVFVHVPKAAGTSVTNVFSQYTNYCDLEIGGTDFGEQIQPAYRKRFGIAKHTTAMDLRALIGTVQWSKYFTFSFVRNPYARALSTFNFLRKWEGLNPEFSQKINSFNTFEEYVLSDIWDETNGPDEIFRPQIYWLRESQTSTDLIVDYVGKVEDISKDMAKIINTIGLQKTLAKAVPKLNASKEFNIDQFRNDKVVEKISIKYKLDFEKFNYGKDLVI